jgi:glycosyltransferase involved in cell wall biosynthesis
MKISVAMATYDGEMYLREQLQSIAEQFRLPDEVIICDDGSSDGTKQICRAFAASMPFVVRLQANQSNLGPIRNFQQAVELCNGDVIVLCDQDDCWYPEKLLRIEQTFSSSPNVGLLFSDAELIGERGHLLNRRLWQYTFKTRYQRQFRTGKAFEVLVQHDIVTGATLAFRERFRDVVLPLPTDIPLLHDGWIALILAAITDVAILREPLIKYRLHRQQHLGFEPFKERVPEVNSQDLSPLAMRSSYYSGEIKKLLVVQQRLTAMARMIEDPTLLTSLQARIAYVETLITHFRAREGLPEGKWSRGQTVLKELLTLRYHRYSRGLLSVLRDLSI